MVQGPEDADPKHGHQQAIDDITFEVVNAFSFDFFGRLQIFLFDGQHLFIFLESASLFGGGVIATERDEQPRESVVDMHVVVGEDTEDPKDVIDQLVALQSDVAR